MTSLHINGSVITDDSIGVAARPVLSNVRDGGMDRTASSGGARELTHSRFWNSSARGAGVSNGEEVQRVTGTDDASITAGAFVEALLDDSEAQKPGDAGFDGLAGGHVEISNQDNSI